MYRACETKDQTLNRLELYIFERAEPLFSRKASDTFKFLRHVMRAIGLADQIALIDASLLKESPLKPCANPPAREWNVSRANLYENEVV